MKRRQIFIELTSLLDVILIMIFVLLTQARAQTTEAVDKADAYQAAFEQEAEALTGLSRENSELREKNKALKEDAENLRRRLVTQGVVLENSAIVTLSIGEDRSIVFQEEEDVFKIAYDWGNNDTYVKNRLTSLFSDTLSRTGEKSLFLVFQYDREGIYKTEYELIMKVIREVRLDAKMQDIPVNVIELDIGEIAENNNSVQEK